MWSRGVGLWQNGCALTDVMNISPKSEAQLLVGLGGQNFFFEYGSYLERFREIILKKNTWKPKTYLFEYNYFINLCPTAHILNLHIFPIKELSRYDELGTAF